LYGRLAAFAAVAVDTAGDDVLPILVSSLGCGNDVVEGQLRARQPPSAVLAAVFISKKDIGSRERYVMKTLGDSHSLAESQHGGMVQADGDTSNDAIVGVQNLHLALDEQDHRPLPGDYPQGLVCGVE
jgi:hypothetical protein